jgi:hypothetical protein
MRLPHDGDVASATEDVQLRKGYQRMRSFGRKQSWDHLWVVSSSTFWDRFFLPSRISSCIRTMYTRQISKTSAHSMKPENRNEYRRKEARETMATQAGSNWSMADLHHTWAYARAMPCWAISLINEAGLWRNTIKPPSMYILFDYFAMFINW